MPRQKRGRSKQDYETPGEFIRAVEERFGPLDVDLAARADNAKAPRWISPKEDSILVPWAQRFGRSLAWLNPEFANIAPWAEKCDEETLISEHKPPTGFRVLLLTPASVGSWWFERHVHRKAIVLALSPRLTFVGCADTYPKDCMLSLFGFGAAGFDTWRWR